MKVTILYMVLVAIFFGNGSKAQIINMTPIVVLMKTEGDGGPAKGLQDIPKATQCGGSGDLRSVRCQGCKISNGSATYTTLDQVLGEINYIPASDSKCLLLRIEVAVGLNKPEVVYDETIINSAVKAGFMYTIHVTTLMHRNVSGQKIRAKFIITDKAVSAPRLCVAVEAMVAEK